MMKKGECKSIKMKWRGTKLSYACRGSKKNVKWQTLPTYIDALGADGETIDGKHSPLYIGFETIETSNMEYSPLTPKTST
jgi:hypothetical protein